MPRYKGERTIPEHIFVYGTLCRFAGHPMRHKLLQYATYMENGWINGTLYDLGQYPGLVSGTHDNQVSGEIYRIAEVDPLLGILDEYEGCLPDAPLPREYVRSVATVKKSSGRINCWVYEYIGEVADKAIIHTGCYQQYVQNRS